MAGCRTTSTVAAYSGPPKPDAELAILKGEDANLSVGFMAVWRAENLVLVRRLSPRSTGYPEELKLEPGQYIVKVQCVLGVLRATPVLAVTVARGNTYVVACSHAGEKYEGARAHLVRVDVHAPQ